MLTIVQMRVTFPRSITPILKVGTDLKCPRITWTLRWLYLIIKWQFQVNSIFRLAPLRNCMHPLSHLFPFNKWRHPTPHQICQRLRLHLQLHHSHLRSSFQFPAYPHSEPSDRVFQMDCLLWLHQVWQSEWEKEFPERFRMIYGSI